LPESHALFIGVPPPRRPVSIICVFSDAPGREPCLDGSIERHRPEVLATDRADGGTTAFDEVDGLRHGERNTA
jgi:hypothetical protein